MAGVRDVDVATAKELVQQGGVLLDVRELDEWDAGHAPGAQHIAMGELAARQADIPSDVTVVAVCRSGNRSSRVASAMSGAGYDVVNLDGGMRAWERSGEPVVRDDGSTGQVI